MNDKLIRAYRSRRQYWTRASDALRMARDAIANNRPISYPRESACIGAAWKSGSSMLRYVDGYSRMGLRFIGYADDVAKRAIEHQGWFNKADEYDSVLRGAVFLLPGRDGHARAIPGYIEMENGKPLNDDSASLCFDDIELIETDSDDMAEFRDVAMTADSIAQHAAEREREYNTAWQAGSRYASNVESVREMRKDAHELMAAMRADTSGNETIRRTLQSKLTGTRNEARELIAECRELRAGDWNSGNYSLQFYAGDAELKQAFNEGAGL